MSYFELSENPEFNSQMRKLEKTDPAAADLFNTLFKQLLENEVSIVNGTVIVGNADKLDGNDSTVFALKTDLTPLAKTSDLADYAKVASLSVYAKVSDLSVYAKTADLSAYAKTSDLSVYATTAALSSYAKTSDLTVYAKTSELSAYAKANSLASYLLLSGGNITGNLTIGSKQVFHAGNSRPIVVGSTAPTDTTAIWIQ